MSEITRGNLPQFREFARNLLGSDSDGGFASRSQKQRTAFNALSDATEGHAGAIVQRHYNDDQVWTKLSMRERLEGVQEWARANGWAPPAAYEESMRPLFERAAEIAAEKGYCPQYDEIAKALGAPTRAELLTAKLPTEPGYYESEKYPLIEGRNPYYLSPRGGWYEVFGGGSSASREPSQMAAFAPLHLLGRSAS